MRIWFLLTFIAISIFSGCIVEPTKPEEMTTLYYQPIQCEEAPWDKWYAEGNIRFVNEPSQEELITTYFGQEKGAEIYEVRRDSLNTEVCQACGTCPEPYFFIADIEKRATEILISEGWQLSPP